MSSSNGLTVSDVVMSALNPSGSTIAHGEEVVPRIHVYGVVVTTMVILE